MYRLLLIGCLLLAACAPGAANPRASSSVGSGPSPSAPARTEPPTMAATETVASPTPSPTPERPTTSPPETPTATIEVQTPLAPSRAPTAPAAMAAPTVQIVASRYGFVSAIVSPSNSTCDLLAGTYPYEGAVRWTCPTGTACDVQVKKTDSTQSGSISFSYAIRWPLGWRGFNTITCAPYGVARIVLSPSATARFTVP